MLYERERENCLILLGRSSKKGKDIPLKLSNASDLQVHDLRHIYRYF